MKIGIIGGGAVGLLYGAYYSLDYQISIKTRTQEQANILKQIGILMTVSEKESYYAVRASAEDSFLCDQDLIVIAVKQYQLPSIIPTLLKIRDETPLLFVQNGMGHLDLLHQLPHKTIFVGTVEHGVKKIGYNQITHTGIGRTNIALFRGEQEKLSEFPLSSHPNFPFQFHDNYEEILQSKLIVNAIINPLTAIFQVKNGVLLENPHFRKLMKKLHLEVVSVFERISVEDSLAQVESICLQTKENTSSMLKDMMEGRQTEIDAILGYILKEGKKKGKFIPLTETIYQMIKGLELERGNH